MIGGGYLIYIFLGIHFEPNFSTPLTLNQFLNSSNVYIGTKGLARFVEILTAHKMI
jgi:hypothetical protein